MIATERTVSRWRVAVWVMVGVLIVAHGCHAGRDTELLARPVIRLPG